MNQLQKSIVAELKEFLNKNGSLSAQYQNLSEINTHLIKFTPQATINSSDELMEAEINLYLSLSEKFPLEDFTFLSDNSSLQITNPTWSYNRHIEEYLTARNIEQFKRVANYEPFAWRKRTNASFIHQPGFLEVFATYMEQIRKEPEPLFYSTISQETVSQTCTVRIMDIQVGQSVGELNSKLAA